MLVLQMQYDFITKVFFSKKNINPHFRSLLHSEHIDVSYFAAGIVAHIASEGEEFWSCSCISWKEMIDELVSFHINVDNLLQ